MAAGAAAPLQVAWLFVRNADRLRVDERRESLSRHRVYSSAVRALLPGLPYSGGLQATSSPNDFAVHFDGFNGRVLALAVLRPLWSPTTMTFLSQEQLIMQDFWRKCGVNGPLFYMELVQAKRLEDPELQEKQTGCC